jgi:hypothetical protein
MAAKRTKRYEDISRRPKINKRLKEVFADVEKGFTDQRERGDRILDYWDCYKCVLGEKQFYNGNSKIYVPLIRSAVNARKTRFINQMFPKVGRYVEVTTEDGEIPHATMSLCEYYIRRAKLKTQVMPALLEAGDIEGQYTIYVDWGTIDRHVVSRETKPVEVEGLEYPELGSTDQIIEETVADDGPTVEVISDNDLLILPVTTNSIDECLERGGSVTVLRRWTKGKIKKLMEDGELEKDAGKELLDAMSKRDQQAHRDTAKELARTAGIKAGEGSSTAHVFETWVKLKVDGDMRLCRAYYGGDDMILGCKLCPYWCDKCPIISAPVQKDPGLMKGDSLIRPGVMDMQITANDAINEGMDAAAYALLPIVMTDPQANPRYGTMVMDLAAVWETDPKSTTFAKFPPLWQDAFQIVQQAKQQIFESLSVSPSMVPQQSGKPGAKRNQAEVAQEQQVDLLTTADAVGNLEESILTPMVQRFIDYDHQFRDDDKLIPIFGEMGLRAAMERVPPIAMDRKFSLVWFGVEAAKNAAQIQQMISTLNVLKGIPPEMYQGYKFNAVPAIVHIVENTFGPRLAPLIFVSERDQLTVDPDIENEMLREGFAVQVHPGDDDAKHIQAHMAVLPSDQSGQARVHMQRHQLQMQAKAAIAQQKAQGQPGGPGGAGPGVAGTPKPGSQPQQPRGVRGPPGMIRPDSMPAAGAVGMPRRA